MAAEAMQRNQLMQAAIAQAKQEGDEALRQKLLKERQREILTVVQQDSRALHESSSVHPDQVLVRIHVIMSNLDGWRVVPDSFADVKEKEDAALLWRKLINLVERCKTLMTEQQIELCDDCLKAIWLQSFVRITVDRLVPYENYQQAAAQLEKEGGKKKKFDRVKTTLWVLFILLVVGVFIVDACQDSLPSSAGFVWFVAGEALGIGAIVYWILAARQLREFCRLENLCQELSSAAYIQDGDFWQAVREQFGGIPTMDILTQKWNEQDIIIRKMFQEPDDQVTPK